MKNYSKIINSLKTLLNRKSSQKRKQWWEKYLKYVIPFRGVNFPQIRELLVEWREEYGVEHFSEEDQLEIMMALFREEYAEDKLAAILYLQYYLYDRLAWNIQLERYRELYSKNLIFDM